MGENSIYVEEGIDAGRIKSENLAHEVANLEKSARDRELGLEKQTTTGLTESERLHLELMDGIKEKFPHAYKSTIDPQGREIMRLLF